MPIFRESKVVLVLGGGGVRGLAHLGVLKVLEEGGVKIDGIVGTSAGAIIGAMYARDPKADVLIKRLLEFFRSSAFRRLNLRFDLDSRSSREGPKPSLLDRILNGLKRQLAMELLFRRPAIFSNHILRRLVKGLVGDGLIEDTSIPLYVCAVDLISGDEIVLDSGDLRTAVVASSSVPGFFPPVKQGDQLLTDAGLINNMPVGVGREKGADCVLAVSLNNDIEPIMEFATGIDVIFRNEEIGTRIVNEEKKKLADVVIEPDLNNRYWLDFSDPEEVIQAGEDAARPLLPAIKDAAQRRRLNLGGG